MKQYSKKLFSLVVLCSTATVMLHADSNDNNGRVSPFLQWRSEGRDMARKLYGTTSYAVYQDDMDIVYGTFNATVQYDQTFRGKEISHALFGNSLVNNPAATTTTTNNCNNSCDNSCDETIVISGLLTKGTGALNTTRAATEWMAENFYLPRNFNSTLTFSPKVSNILVDFNLYVGLDRWVKGMYFRLYGPVVHNKSGLHVEENVIFAGDVEGSYDQGYFNPAAIVQNTVLFQNALSFFGGCPAPVISGLALQPLMFAKLSNCNLPNTTTTNNNCSEPCGSSSHKKTGFAELRGEFGWNYITDKYRFLINVQAAAPTGTRPNAEYALEAQIGNGKHWELGIGLGGAWKMWENEDADKSFNFIVEADITHLFDAKQTRTFDLIYNDVPKPNSRYMLAEKLVALPTTGTFLSDGSAAGYQFGNAYAPVANLTTQNVKVSIGVQGDVVAMFNYTCRGFSWDLGYNFWGMSRSKIKCTTDDCSDECGIVPFPANTWALKGDAEIAGNGTAAGAVRPVLLAATESLATIFNGTNPVADAAVNANAGIDGATVATFNQTPPDLVVVNGAVVSYNYLFAIDTSVKPIFISASNFDYKGAETSGYSNKVFTHFSYTWNTNNDKKYLPYLGAGFSAQFGNHNGNDDDCPSTVTTTNNCDDNGHVNIALSNWAVEIKGGVSFH